MFLDDDVFGICRNDYDYDYDLLSKKDISWNKIKKFSIYYSKIFIESIIFSTIGKSLSKFSSVDW